MIVKDCLGLAVERLGPIIAGRVVVDDHRGAPHPTLRVRAVIAGTHTVLAESTSTRQGEFRLELGVPLPVAAQLQLIDGDGAVLGGADVTLREPVEVTAIPVAADRLAAARPVRPDAPPPGLLHRASVEALRRQVATLVREGVLEPESVGGIERALAPLAWAEALLGDARAVLAGDMEAAHRLRAALLSLGAPASLPDDERGAGPGNGEADKARDEAELILDRAGLAQLAAAVVWAVDDPDEAQAMLNGLAGVLWSSPWLELLLRAATTGATSAMRPLMAGPGAGWGLPPGLTRNPMPAPGVPGVPGLPGGPPNDWGKVPKPKGKVPGKIADLVPDLKVPINRMPTEDEKCLAGAMATVAMKKRALPQYEIRAIDDAAACPGTVLVITGVDFGAAGFVIFPGKGSGVIASDVPSWTDTTIRVRVPEGAAPGVIRLSIYEGTLCLCGRSWPLYRLGRTLPTFDGGVPVVLSFNVNGATSAMTVAPGDTVTVTLTTSTGTGVSVQLIVRDGTTTVFDSGPQAGGFHAFTFAAPTVKAPTTLTAEIRAANRCGVSREEFTVLIVRQPRLRILQAEVTQAVQRLDNSVRLGAHRRTMVRVYIDSGLGLFSYAGNASAIAGVTGSIRVSRAGQELAVVAPLNAPFTTVATFFPTARQSLGGSLNFLLPVEHLSGDIRLDISVRLESLPAGVTQGAGTSTARTVHVTFTPMQKVSLVRVMLADQWRGLPAPTVAEWQAALQGAMARFPVADSGWEIRVHPGHTVVTVDRDLSTDDGWDDLLEDLDDVAGDSDDSWDHRWVGLLPAARAGIDTFGTKGMARNETTDRPWPLSNDYLVMACVAGRPEVFAHELAHTFAIDHANCPAGTPKDIDPSLPAFLDQTGVDLYAMAPVLEFTTGELMGYCASNGLWPSTVTWQRFIEGLD